MRPPRSEWFWLGLLLGGFLAFNLATYNYYPAVWCDEVWFADAAINLVKHGSFTTMTWQLQPVNTFPVVNCPLYTMALAPWLAVAGTSLLAVRSFNYLLMTLAAFLCWRTVWRYGLVRSTPLRLVLVAMLHLGYGMSYSYRCSRPDILAIVCLLLLALAFEIRQKHLRHACLGCLAALLVWIGLPAALFAWVAAALAWWVLRRPRLQEMVALSLGMALGAVDLALFLAWKGVLGPFLVHVVGFLGKRYAHVPHLSASGALVKIVQSSATSYVDDFSMVAITLGLAVLLTAAWRRLSQATRRLTIFSLVLAFGVPPLFNVAGHFAFYYSYMRFVPAVVAIFAVYSDLTSAGASLRPAIRWAFLATLALAAAVGLPLRLGLTAATANVVPRKEVQRIVGSVIRPDDVVLSDYAYFFEVKQAASAVYDRFCSPMLRPTFLPGRDLTPGQKQSISVLVIRPNEKEMLMRYFGGQWTAVSAPFGDTFTPGVLGRLPWVGRRIVHYLNQRQNERYQLQIFRRLRDASAPAPAADLFNGWPVRPPGAARES